MKYVLFKGEGSYRALIDTIDGVGSRSHIVRLSVGPQDLLANTCGKNPTAQSALKWFG